MRGSGHLSTFLRLHRILARRRAVHGERHQPAVDDDSPCARRPANGPVRTTHRPAPAASEVTPGPADGPPAKRQASQAAAARTDRKPSRVSVGGPKPTLAAQRTAFHLVRHCDRDRVSGPDRSAGSRSWSPRIPTARSSGHDPAGPGHSHRPAVRSGGHPKPSSRVVVVSGVGACVSVRRCNRDHVRGAALGTDQPQSHRRPSQRRRSCAIQPEAWQPSACRTGAHPTYGSLTDTGLTPAPQAGTSRSSAIAGLQSGLQFTRDHMRTPRTANRPDVPIRASAYPADQRN